MLVLFVRDRREPLAPTPKVTLRDVGALVRSSSTVRLVTAACMLGLVTVGDGFVYLTIQEREGLSLVWFPLLAVGTNLVYLLLAVPCGALADRVGRRTMLVAGYVPLACVYVLLFSSLEGYLFIGLTIALVQTGQALSYLVSSVLFGLAWQFWGLEPAFAVAAASVLVTMAVSGVLLRGLGRPATA